MGRVKATMRGSPSTNKRITVPKPTVPSTSNRASMKNRSAATKIKVKATTPNRTGLSSSL